MEKECEICGCFFDTDKKNRKYCDDCSAHTEARRREYEAAARRVYWRTYEPKTYQGTCPQCGKEFKALARRVVRQSNPEGGDDLAFCSKRCRKEWLHSRDLCDHCGAPLDGGGVRPEELPGWKFCSESCMNLHLKEERLRIGEIRTCEFCGRRFMNGNSRFCSESCYRKFRSKKWKSNHVSRLIRRFFIRRETCCVCGASGESIHPLPLEYGYKFPRYACSYSCKAVLDKWDRQKRERQDREKQKGLQEEGQQKTQEEEHDIQAT